MAMTDQMTGSMFKLLNFVVLLGVIFYVFRKYLLPGLKKELADYVAYLDGLRRSLQMLQNDVYVTQKAIESDIVTQEQLKEYVKRWHAAVAEQRAVLIREREERKGALIKRYEEHKEQIAFYGSYKRLVPEVIEQVRADLIKLFTNETKQQRFITTMMRDLPKG